VIIAGWIPFCQAYFAGSGRRYLHFYLQFSAISGHFTSEATLTGFEPVLPKSQEQAQSSTNPSTIRCFGTLYYVRKSRRARLTLASRQLAQGRGKLTRESWLLWV